MRRVLQKLKRSLWSFLNIYYNKYKKTSFSQSGEDIIVEGIFKLRNIDKPTYIDIGAFHPYSLSNTVYFYLKGCRGINIEPNPDSFSLFLDFRPSDINLNLGVGNIDGVMKYFSMNAPTMNSFDEESANKLVSKHGFKIVNVKDVPVKPLQVIIDQYANGKFPDFLSLDVEGGELSILKHINYGNNFPKVICIETAEYSIDAKGLKNSESMNYLLEQGYFIYADTGLNTIFVNKSFWG